MRANLAQREPEILKRWEEERLYDRLRRGRRRADPSSCCTTARPTPTATSTSATPSTRCSRTSSSRARTLDGFDAPYVPGWDCHGLPIELQVEKQVGKPGERVDAAAIPQARAASTPRSQVDRQRRGLHAARRARRLGQPLPDDGLRDRGGHHPRARADRRQRPPGPGLQAGALVHRLRLGAGRGRGRVRGQGRPRHRCALPRRSTRQTLLARCHSGRRPW